MTLLELANSAEESVLQAFYNKLNSGSFLTRTEGALEHLCVYFLPVCKRQSLIYLVDHIKAGTWLPPGGHLEPGERPEETVIREFKEELGISPKRNNIKLFGLSITPISDQQGVCTKHFDLWYCVNFPKKEIFEWDKGEFSNAGWFGFEEGIKMLQKYPNYVEIIRRLQQETFITPR